MPGGPSATPALPEPETREHVEASGLRVTTKLLHWPPASRDDERKQVRLYFARYYDRRRKRLDVERRGKEQKIETEKMSAADRKSTFLIISLVLLVTGGVVATAVPPFGAVMIGGALIIFLAGVTVATPPFQAHEDEELPALADLEALYDRLCNEDLATLWNGARRVLALDKAGPPERMVGPTLNYPNLEETGDAYIGARLGSDKIARFTPRSVFFLSFHAEQIISYEGATDVIKGVPIYHKLREFSYQDVVSISRTTRTKSFLRAREEAKEGEGEEDTDLKPTAANSKEDIEARTVVTSVDEVRLELINGETVSMILNDTYLASSTADTSVPQNESDSIVEVIRALVRDKKHHVLAGRSTGAAGAAPFGAAFANK